MREEFWFYLIIYIDSSIVYLRHNARHKFVYHVILNVLSKTVKVNENRYNNPSNTENITKYGHF